MKATELLKKQHKEVADLFERIEAAEQASVKKALFEELAGKLVAHDGIEREIFYPACEKKLTSDEDQDMLGEALVEHGLVEFTLFNADRERGKVFDARVKVLKDIVEHHVEEEEKELFPEVEKAFAGSELEKLGQRMEEAFEEKVEEDFRPGLEKNVRQVVSGAIKTSPKAAPAQRAPAKRTPARATKSAAAKKPTRKPQRGRKAA
ncbi:MAG: hemerythrin domain-containing protein [Polyangiaceae bacterium]